MSEASPFRKTCPHCQREIKARADLCKFCGGDVTDAALARLAEAKRLEAEGHPDTKTCPYCAEDVRWEACVCRYCQRDLINGARPAGGAVATVVAAPQQVWSPGVAAVLSLVIPGAGQMYKGQIANGLLWLVLVVVGYFLFIIPGLVLHVCCIVGASMGDPMEVG